MNLAPTPIPADQTSYIVIRPVDDLWLWWTVVSVISSLLSQVSSLLFKGSFIVSGLAFVISLFLVIRVLSHYLGNFNGKRWIIVNIVSILVAVVLLLVIALVIFLIYRIINTNASPPTEIEVLVFIPLFAWIIALAQWRVLKDYAGARDRGLWVIANIISALIIGITSTVVNGLTDDQYIKTGSTAISNVLGALVIGYVLTRILRAYAPGSVSVR